MKVKRYMVNDMNEAMIMIKNELGKDAIILSSRKVKAGGFFGLFHKSKFEVLAAIEDEIQVKAAQTTVNGSERDKAVLDTYLKVKETNEPIKEKREDISHFNSELNELKAMVSQLMQQSTETPSVPSHLEEPMEKSKLPEGMQKMVTYLQSRDIEEPYARKIAEILMFDGELPQNLDAELRLVLQKLIGKPFVIEKSADSPKVCFFVGPTGVGKTTTLAKLAAKLSLIENKKIGLVTSDTYRIAAVDQLKTYSEILGIPLTVIYEADELPMALSKYSDRDYILVDTAGRSQTSKEFESDISALLQYVEEPEIFLVISLTTGYKEIRKILDAYSYLDDFKLLFTKLDESSSLGNVLNARMLTNKSLSYFTIGQSVPDDIEVANPDRIINYIVGE